MNKWNNKFRYQVASCWLFILSYTTMHGSMNIKFFSLVCLVVFSRILDDLEMYEQQTPFRLTDYVNISSFLNCFLYKGVLGNLFGKLLNM